MPLRVVLLHVHQDLSAKATAALKRFSTLSNLPACHLFGATARTPRSSGSRPTPRSGLSSRPNSKRWRRRRFAPRDTDAFPCASAAILQKTDAFACRAAAAPQPGFAVDRVAVTCPLIRAANTSVSGMHQELQQLQQVAAQGHRRAQGRQEDTAGAVLV